MVWDLPTRLFHWSFAISIVGAFLTGREGNLFWHEIFGLAALGLFVFRIIWGVSGMKARGLKPSLWAQKNLGLSHRPDPSP